MLRLYRRNGVAADCLRLQDRYGLDVTLMLFACYLAAAGAGPLSVGECRRLDRAVDKQRRASVLALRQMRRALKPPAGRTPDAVTRRFRARLLAAEIAAERLLLDRLVALRPRPGAPGPDRAADALTSLGHHARARGLSLSAGSTALLRRLARRV